MLTREDIIRLEDLATRIALLATDSDDAKCTADDVAWVVQRLNQLNQNFLALQRRETILRAALREFL